MLLSAILKLLKNYKLLQQDFTQKVPHIILNCFLRK